MPDFKDKAKFTDSACDLVSGSGAAIHVRIEGKWVWMPVSQVDDDSEVWKPGQEGQLVVSEWIAIEKGLV
jgi:hypothetical protein